MFVDWIYCGHLPASQDLDIVSLIDTYLLGDKLLCPILQNDIQDTIQLKCKENSLDYEDLIPVIKNGLIESKLLKYLIIQLAFEMKGDYEGYTEGKGWEGFLSLNMTVTKRLMDEIQKSGKTKKSSDPSTTKDCRWHVHAEGEVGKGKRRG